ncbi:hypothetical protein [Desulfovermiculus halophilus]|uniref:hypothetical protein n=1 Tax=Desulfovermiculus halophilus TaxID=339722 RepID=UPI0004852EBC|nr:hypothetical protein [Desulfovermiculus halophilus]
MTTKERVKQEIDQMPEELVENVFNFIEYSIKKQTDKKQLHTYKLNGAFDKIDIREKAYE